MIFYHHLINESIIAMIADIAWTKNILPRVSQANIFI